MTDDQLEPAPRRRRREHPIIAGVIALVVVAVVVGVIIGGGTLVVSKALGIDDATATDPSSSSSASLYLPDPTDTATTPGSYITLSDVPDSESASPDGDGEPTDKGDDKPEKDEPAISLSAGQTAVAPMQNIDLTGVYPDGEGAILRVQQFKEGGWTDFPVTAPVAGGQFTTYIQAGAIGLNRFRMIDTDTGETSNEVKVQIG